MTTHHDPQTVRELAYKLWVERGRPEGGAETDWLEAERQLLGPRKTESQAVDEAVKESFPASDPPASGLPDKPPSNASEKWRQAEAQTTGDKPKKKRAKAEPVAAAAPLKTSSPSEATPEDLQAGRKRRETPKLGSRDAPGG
jgi:hypothetical protein